MKHDWFYMKGADKRGPVSTSKLRELAKNGQLLPTDLVWREGMKDWKRAGKIAGLFDGTGQPTKQAAPSQQSAALTPPKRPPAPPSNLLGNVGAPKRPPTPPHNLVGNVAATSNPASAAKPSYKPPAVGPPPTAAPAGADGIFRCPHCRQEISNDSSVAGEVVGCPHCAREFRMAAGPMARPITTMSPTRTTTSSQRTGTRQKKPWNWKRIRTIYSLVSVGLLVLSCIICGVLSPLLPVTGLEINGDQATLTYLITYDQRMRLEVMGLAERIHDAATKHPEVKTIHVYIELYVSTVVDRFGNPKPLDEKDGPHIVDADEVRKYTDWSWYRDHEELTLGLWIYQAVKGHPNIFPELLSGK